MKLAALTSIVSEASGPMNWTCDYWVTTPKGNKSRATRSGAVYSLDGGEPSEWAVLDYLRKIHQGATISIISCKFR